MLKIESFQRPEWSPLPYEGCINVEGKVLQRLQHVSIAMLKFAENAEIHEHDAPIEIDVYCLEGEGMVRVAGEESVFKAGQRVHWPAGVQHKLWTDKTTMLTLMVEHENTETP
jgi:quercetin dioxygenase-like cupin family protein